MLSFTLTDFFTFSVFEGETFLATFLAAAFLAGAARCFGDFRGVAFFDVVAGDGEGVAWFGEERIRSELNILHTSMVGFLELRLLVFFTVDFGAILKECFDVSKRDMPLTS